MKRSFTFVKAITLFACSIVIVSETPAQNNPSVQNGCGTTLKTEQLYQQNPGLQQQAEANELRMHEESKHNLNDNRSATPPTYVIPVVFHVIHNYGTENITDAQILDAVAMLNEDYRKLNADTSQIVPPFDTIAADCEIEFRLAQLDPNGNCTNGVDRIASMETYVGDNDSKLNQWPRDKYLNIWVVKQMPNSVAGYAYFPSSVDPPSLEPYDGVMILSDYVGRIGTGSPTTARTLTHMVGHFLGLAHLGYSCVDGDGIADTPVTVGWFTCQLTNNDACNPGIPENVQNFMEGSYCQRMFTRGQRDFMHNVLNSSISDRNNLWIAANLILTGVNNSPTTCIPHADFKSNRKMVCEGGSVTFTDMSWSSSATSWQWTLSGPTVLTATTQNPLFNMNVAGWYDVTLIASNSAGSDTVTRTNYLLVSSDTVTFNTTYSEGFELPNTFYFGYIANDKYGNGSVFSQTNTAGNTGTSSVLLNNWTNCVKGDVDELITPSYFLSYNTNLQISFAYAYATADTATALNTQVLKLWTSVDCGQSWSLRWTRYGTALLTAGYVPIKFIPSGANDWDTVIVSLPTALPTPNVRFKFEFTSPEDSVGNNLYIDDINILATNVGMNESESENSFNVFPNPSDGNSMISYSLDEQSQVKTELYDMSGRFVRTIYSGEQAAGSYTMAVSDDTNPLAPGTYLIQMTIGETVSTQKYIVTAPE